VATGAVLGAVLGWPIGLRRAVPIAVAVVLTTFALPSLWAAARGLDGVRDGLKAPEGFNEREKCFIDVGQQGAIPFVRWVRERIPAGATFELAGRLDPGCFQLVLLPRVWAAKGERPQYRVYAGAVPGDVRARIRAERRLPAGGRTVESFSGDELLVRER